MLGQVGGQAGRAAKTADADLAGKWARPFGSPGERAGDLQRITKMGCGAARQRRRLRGASQNQEPLPHHQPTRARKPPWRSTTATSIAVLPDNVASATSRACAATAQ